VTVRGYTILSGNSAYESSIISRDLTPARIQETWEKMCPENRYGQMTYEERLAFATSDEGKDYLFPLGLTLDGKRYETKFWRSSEGLSLREQSDRANPFA